MLYRQQAGGELRLRAHSDFVVILLQDLADGSARSLRHHRRIHHLIGQTRRSGSSSVVVLFALGVASSGQNQNAGRTLLTNPRTLGVQGYESI
jgi:hypothetical protein